MTDTRHQVSSVNISYLNGDKAYTLMKGGSIDVDVDDEDDDISLLGVVLSMIPTLHCPFD
jgi:hypothetical protein